MISRKSANWMLRPNSWHSSNWALGVIDAAAALNLGGKGAVLGFMSSCQCLLRGRERSLLEGVLSRPISFL